MALIRTRELFVQPGHNFGILTRIGTVYRKAFFRVIALEETKISNFSLGSITSGGNASTWTAIENANGDKLTVPESQDIINHCFVGVTPGSVRVYSQYPRGNIIKQVLGQVEPSDSTARNYGWFDGLESPYRQPQKISEFVTLFEVESPYYNCYNPMSSTETVLLNFVMGKYLVEFIDDVELIKDLVSSKRRTTYLSFGGIERGIGAPSWLASKIAAVMGKGAPL